MKEASGTSWGMIMNRHGLVIARLRGCGSRWAEGAAAAQNDRFVMGTFGNTANAARTSANKKATQHQK
ncbi:hypothetical protein [Comamonas sp. MYb69]|uniref:hypothetical protein n=1 Tax=Comamonas sp. MYb69 TaxID=1848650 RepID=UPI0030B12FF4